jgi:hypothetical protein
VLIVKKRDTGKMNALKEEGTKRSSNWSDGARAPCHRRPHPPHQELMVTLQLGGKSNSYVILVWPIQLLKNQRAPYPKENCLFKGPQELSKTTTGQKAELLT